MDPDAIDRVLRKHAAAIGLTRGYSAHSMRATFITTALENGATLDDVQRAAGHSEPSTTKLYDRRGYNPESASFLRRIERVHRFNETHKLISNMTPAALNAIVGVIVCSDASWSAGELCSCSARRRSTTFLTSSRVSARNAAENRSCQRHSCSCCSLVG